MTWSDFQSVIQLSIGFNIAYFTVPGLFLEGYERELRTYRTTIEFFERKYSTNEEEIRDYIRTMKDETVQIENEKQKALRRITSSAIPCLIAFVLGMILLTISSYRANDELSVGWQAVIFLTVLPYVFCFAVSVLSLLKLPWWRARENSLRTSMALASNRQNAQEKQPSKAV